MATARLTVSSARTSARSDCTTSRSKRSNRLLQPMPALFPGPAPANQVRSNRNQGRTSIQFDPWRRREALLGAVPRGSGTAGTPYPVTDEVDGLMADNQEYRALTREELDQLAGEPLPERAAMSLINANVAAPVNLAAALNVLSDNSVAVADATQTAPITQTN